MNTLTALFSVTLAAQEGPAPEDVKAGWLGLLVWLALAIAVVFLAFSLRKHLKRVDFVEEEPDRSDRSDTGPRTADGSANGSGNGATRS